MKKRKKAYRSLAIIGNGFDLNHGLPTGFDAFSSLLPVTISEKFKKFLSDYCVVTKHWSDFEDAIAKLSESCLLRSYNDAYDYEQVLQDIDELNTLFEEIRKELTQYLLSETTKNPINTKPSIKKYLKRNRLKVINFNYTNTADHYAKDIFHIHGSLADNDIVLGYDFRQEANVAEYRNICWNKTLLRDKLEFNRYIKQQYQLPYNSVFFKELREDLETVQSYQNSGIGFSETSYQEDIDPGDSLRHPDVILQYLAHKRSKKHEELPDLDYSKIRTIIIIGHGIFSDQVLISSLLKKCHNLKKVIIFTYKGESEEKLTEKANFFRPYCKKIKKVSY